MVRSRILNLVAGFTLLALIAGCGGAKKSVTTEAEAPATPAEPAVSYGEIAALVSGPTQLTFHESNNGLGSYHPAGDRIVFQSDRDGRWQLYQLILADNSEVRLLDSPSNDENPVWLPDSSGVLFVSDRSEGAGELSRDIYMYLENGGSVAPAAVSAADDWYPTPLDGMRFSFLSERDGGVDVFGMPVNALYVGSLDGTPPQPLLTAGVDPSSPAPLGDGAFIIRDGDGKLFRLDPAKNSLDPLTPSTLHCGIVSYSPARKLAAVTILEGERYILYLFDPATGTLQKVETGEGEVRYPQFSLDGSKLLFSREVGQKFQLFEVVVAQ